MFAVDEVERLYYENQNLVLKAVSLEAIRVR